MAAFAAQYARALADVVLENHLRDHDIEAHHNDFSAAQDTERQLSDFAAAWHTSAGLREVFLDPSFPAEQKVAILDKLNARLGMSQQARNFIAVLINHDRIHALDEVLAEFRREINARLGIAEVQVTTARSLEEEERRTLEAQIAEMTKSQVSATFHEDASLLGGVIVRVGSTVYDGSVRGRLDRLKEELAAS
jgi:F-type H+-transporting ATPase subunit delta